MKVKMLTTRLAAPDGIHVQEYKSGQTYDLPSSLSEPWIEAKVCKAVGKPETEKSKSPESSET